MSESTLPHHVPVLIVGGGPVGLSLACELGWQGVPCLLLEQGDGVIAAPKMNEVNIRTMEFCRRWGFVDEVLNCPFPADWPLDVSFVTTLNGYEVARYPRPSRSKQTPDPASPHRLLACSQHWFDPMLKKFAGSFPHVTLRYHARVDSVSQTDNGVTAEVTDLTTGDAFTASADYLVGCDGATSPIRRQLGIDLEGPGTIGHPVSLFFRYPNLIEECGREPATFYMPQDNGGFWGNLRIIDPKKHIWRLMIDEAGESVTETNVDREAALERAVGFRPDVEWLEVSVWRRRSVVAQRFSDRRIFLAGDAVHQLSPTGALGMNSGVADAVDLGWKFAAMNDGWGGSNLMESYHAERRPVGMRNVRMATSFFQANRSVTNPDPAINEDSPNGEKARRELGEKLMRDIANEFRTTGLQIGYNYEDSPIIVPDGTPAPVDDPHEYTPTSRPGARAPHAWLSDNRSMLDFFGKGYVLVTFASAPSSQALEEAARRRGVPLEIVHISRPEVAELYEKRMVLVRPDGHVAWRGDKLPDDALALVDRVRGAA